jgi:cysteine desulfurase
MTTAVPMNDKVKVLEVVFTSCGSEGDNAAIRGILESTPEKRHIITTQVEHPAVRGLCQHLEKKGYRVTWLEVDGEGGLDLDELRDSITDDTAVVSIMFANNETGVFFPVHEAGEIVKARGVPFHVDAVQVPGKIPLDVKNSPIDLLTISAHKFHGPKGVGALFVRRGITFRPFIKLDGQEGSMLGRTSSHCKFLAATLIIAASTCFALPAEKSRADEYVRMGSADGDDCFAHTSDTDKALKNTG